MIRALLDRLSTRHVPRTAGEWFARAQARALTASEARELEHWLAAPANRAEFERSQSLAQVGDRLKGRADLVRQLPAYAALRESALHAPPTVQRPPLRWSMAGLAAATCAALVWMVIPKSPVQEPPALVATKHGERLELPLEDGTRVHLNTDSMAQVVFSERERRVVLARGEGFFDVAKDASRPFIVEVGNTEVRVVGTRFNVRATDAGAEVVVSEGKVEVVPDARRRGPSVAAKVELEPGNALRFDRRENQVRISAVDPERATAWRTGTIDVDNVTVEELVAEVNRYAATPLVIADPRVKSIRLSGSFKAGDVESVQFVLKGGFGVEAVREGDRILLR